MTLQIFRKHPSADAYYIRGAFTPYAIEAKDKRFTDAELAAEYWHSTWDALECWSSGNDEDIAATDRELEAIKRFAILPHFDEVEE